MASKRKAKFPSAFEARVIGLAGGATRCWVWSGSLTSNGYGRFWWNGKHVRAHIFAWELSHGPVPSGMELDHLCRQPQCVNPAHLEPVTHKENVLRGKSPAAVNAGREACVNGHSLTGANLYLYLGKHRHCVVCVRERTRKTRRANLAAGLRYDGLPRLRPLTRREDEHVFQLGYAAGVKATRRERGERNGK